MANEDATPGTICFTKKKIRLSKVVDKLAVLGNGNLLADRENNNVSLSQSCPPALQLPSCPSPYPFVPQSAQAVSSAMCPEHRVPRPRMGATVPDVTPILPESGSAFLQTYFLYGLSANIPPPFSALTLNQPGSTGSHIIFQQDRSLPVQHTVTSAQYYQAQQPCDEGFRYKIDSNRSSPVNMPHSNLNVPTFKEEPKNEMIIDEEMEELSNQTQEVKLENDSVHNGQYQQAPLDLSVKGCGRVMKSKSQKAKCSHSREPKQSKSAGGSAKAKVARQSRAPFPRVPDAAYPVVYGDVASPTTRESVAARYNLQVSPVVEQMPLGSDTAWACPVCGQLFSQRDRLAKHVASRHRGRSPSRSHICHKCNRGFSRSDMLTRHLRLHTGQKPYRCATCGQIFSRSDHLATHRRTHTGEKPYKCPQCPYAACRRDMITRHMRTHRSRPHSRGSSASDSSDSSAVASIIS